MARRDQLPPSRPTPRRAPPQSSALTESQRSLKRLKNTVDALLADHPIYDWGNDRLKITFHRQFARAENAALEFARRGDMEEALAAARIHATLADRIISSDPGESSAKAARRRFILDLSLGHRNRASKELRDLIAGDIRIREDNLPGAARWTADMIDLQRRYNLHALERDAMGFRYQIERAVESHAALPVEAGAPHERVHAFGRYAVGLVGNLIWQATKSPLAYQGHRLDVKPEYASWGVEPEGAYNPEIIEYPKRVMEWQRWQQFGRLSPDGDCDPPDPVEARHLRPDDFEGIDVDARGWPRCELGRQGIDGRGNWKLWGRNFGSEGILFIRSGSKLYLPMYLRADNGRLSLPGGPRRLSETPRQSLTRHMRQRAGRQMAEHAKNMECVWTGACKHNDNTDAAWYYPDLFAGVIELPPRTNPIEVFGELHPSYPYALSGGIFPISRKLFAAGDNLGNAYSRSPHTMLNPGDGFQIMEAAAALKLRIPTY